MHWDVAGMQNKGSRHSRGFSLVEAMVSAGILGIALIGLVKLHTTSIQGTAKAEDIGRATEIARQLADQIASQPLDQMPACGDPSSALGPAPQGCRATEGPGTAMAADKGPFCTRIVGEDILVDADSGAVETIAVGSAEAREAYRVDMLLSAHPNGAAASSQVHVWVCWRDPTGHVNEVYTSRMKIAGVW